MVYANEDIIKKLQRSAQERKKSILNTEDHISALGCDYYVSSEGDDSADGKSPETPWKTTKKVGEAELLPGDCVHFRRGDVFRGGITAKPEVTYCAYGRGEKPRLYSGEKNLADPEMWTLVDKENSIWLLKEQIPDCGALVFNEGEAYTNKLIPSYINGKFVVREDPAKDFSVAKEMKQDLDMFCQCVSQMTTCPSKGEDFPIPDITFQNKGNLYLRCQRGNPGEVFDSIEPLVKINLFLVGGCPNVCIDNLCIKYAGAHGISAGGYCKGLHVTNCEIGWIGGSIQHYYGTDPNFPKGKRGEVTRYGNGVEIYGSCEDYVVENCYIYQCYDAAITHQINTCGRFHEMKKIRYMGNLIENCVYSIEYFLDKTDGDRESYMEDIRIEDNILRLSGYGWGSQRHNKETPAHIKGWEYENTAKDYVIKNNIFYRGACRLIHIVAQKQESCPLMKGNTYIQGFEMLLGKYGGKEEKPPEDLIFDENAETAINEIIGDSRSKVYIIKKRQEINMDKKIKVLFVGNSITIHGVCESIGWTHAWGMAASKEEKDYVHLVMKHINEKYGEATYRICQIGEWEKNHKNGSQLLDSYKTDRDYEADIIIMRLSENCPQEDFNKDAFVQEYVKLVNYLNGGKAEKIIITSSFWKGIIDSAIEEAAKQLNAPFVYLGDIGIKDEMKAIGLFDHPGVAAHPGDKGMKAIAERIIEKL